MGRMLGLANVVTVPSNAKISRGSRGTMTPLAPFEPKQVTMPNSHSSE
jgi:hypothetical protein